MGRINARVTDEKKTWKTNKKHIISNKINICRNQTWKKKRERDSKKFVKRIPLNSVITLTPNIESSGKIILDILSKLLHWHYTESKIYSV